MICNWSENLNVSKIVDSIIEKFTFLLKGIDDMVIDETIFKLKNLTSSDISSFEKIFEDFGFDEIWKLFDVLQFGSDFDYDGFVVCNDALDLFELLYLSALQASSIPNSKRYFIVGTLGYPLTFWK